MQTATSSVEFNFNDIINRQTDGVATGFPLGPAVADVFFDYQKTKLFLNVKKPLTYYHHIDNTFAVFESEDEYEKNYFTQLFLLFVTFHVQKLT